MSRLLLHVKIGDELSATATPLFILTNIGHAEGETFFEGFSPKTGAIFRKTESECRKTGKHYPEIEKLIASSPAGMSSAG